MASVTARAAAPIAKISVFATGEVLLNGTPTTLQALDAALTQLDQSGGVVWYYRQAAESDPPSQAMEVIKLVVKHRLPISMSTKPHFSDTVDAGGNSVPREP
jgi:hypothetical protein